MEDDKRPSASIVTLAVVLLLLPVFYFCYVLLRSNPQVQASIIAFVGVIFTAIWTQFEIKKREIRASLFPEKREAYMQIIKLLVDMLKGAKTGNSPIDPNNITINVLETIFNLKQALMVWGHSDTIKTWIEFEMLDASDAPTRRIELLERLLREIRKDLGHNDAKLKFGSLIGLFLDQEAKRTLLRAAPP